MTSFARVSSVICMGRNVITGGWNKDKTRLNDEESYEESLKQIKHQIQVSVL